MRLSSLAVGAMALLLMHCQSPTGSAPASSSSPEAAPLQPQVELLTSVATPTGWSRAGASTLPDALEEDFRQGLQAQGYALLVKHGATAGDLHEALIDPRNIAVFWVSHAGAEESDASGIEVDGIVEDVNGADVKDVFQQIRPGLRWLGIIGCSAKTIIDGFKARGFYTGNPDLTIQDFAQPVDAETGLKNSVAQFASQGMTPGAPLECPNEEGIPIDVNYQLNVPEVQIEIGDQFLAVLKNTENEAAFYVPRTAIASLSQAGEELKLLVNSGLNPDASPAILGDFKFSSASLDSKDWSLFADSSGNPIGAGEELFRYTGNLNLARFVSFSDFNCPQTKGSAL